ncbi:GNAT family protein [Nocardia sp. NPDC048505]|uniref:GNAT family N-acetyltransferase n=1 Tax=unclassified Nocardia TaxID=2637762 RepID=UPI0033E58BE1
MAWPVRLAPADLDDAVVALREYRPADAAALFAALDDDRVWEHLPCRIPCDAAELDTLLQAEPRAHRVRFTVRHRGVIAGTTAVLYDPAAPDGVEIGATMFDPAVWGTGVNARTKQLLIPAVFAQGAAWIQLRTDERNARSAAAIRKLGAVELGVRGDRLVRRDGSVRRSRFFRIDRVRSGWP